MNDVSRQLHEAAASHRPDRARILARVERGMASPADGRPRHREPSTMFAWPKVALAAIGTAGILAAGGFAVAAIVKAPSSRPDAVIVSSSPPEVGTPTSGGLSADATRSPEPSDRPSHPARTSPAASPSGLSSSPPRGTRTSDGPLWSDGSVDPHSTVYWAQSNVTLKTTQPLTALTVELRLAQTGGVQNTGSWQTLPADDFTVTVHEESGQLVYRWTLKPGRTVPPGQHVFAGQYNHATGGRDARSDGYRADADGAGGTVSVWGGFAPTG